MKKTDVPVLLTGTVLVVVATVSAAFAWWLNERAITGPGGIPLPPRTEVIRSESPRAGIITLSCRNARPAGVIAKFYSEIFADNGWKTSRPKTNIYQFTKGRKVLRLVLHSHPRRTDFTLNMRSKNSGRSS